VRNRFSFKSALVGGLFVALLLSAVPVGAAVGDVIRAGQTTSANQTTNLKGKAEFQNLKITNTRAVGVAARFVVKPGNPPFHVSSGVTVPKLNADRVDGVHAAGLLKKKDYDVDKNLVVDDAEAVGGVALSNILPGGVLPAGSTVRGTYAIGGDAAGYLLQGVDFGFTLAAAPVAHYIEQGATAPPECTGSVSNPSAAPGHLCVYETLRTGITTPGGVIIYAANGSAGTSPFGFIVAVSPGAGTAPDPIAYGSWAVTAPAAGAAPGATNGAGPNLGR
jgi:hypothetical protein